MSENIAFDIKVSGGEQLDNIDKKLDNLGKSSKKATNGLTLLRREIKEDKAALLTLEEGTEAYTKTLARLSKNQFAIKDINDKARAATLDMGETAKNVGRSIQGLASGFAFAQGAIALFGDENDATTRTLQNLVAGLSVASGLGEFIDSLESMKDVYSGLKGAFTGGGKEIASAIGDTTSVITGQSAAVTTLGSNIAQTSAIQQSTALQTTAAIDAEIAERNANIAAIEAEIAAINAKASTNIAIGNDKLATLIGYEEEIEKNSELIDIDKNRLAELEKQKAAQVDLGNASEEAGNKGKTAMLGGLATTLLWTAAIAAAVYGIIKLVEWLNEIPTKVQVEIDVESDAIKELGKDKLKLTEFINDYKLAVKQGNTERLELLDEYGRQEFNLRDDQLKEMKTNGLKITDDYFKGYLKIAQDTYFNESIIKRGIDAQVAGKIALNSAESKFKALAKEPVGFKKAGYSWKQLLKYAQDGSFTEQIAEALFVTGVEQQIIDELRIVSEQNAIIKNLPKLRDQAVLDLDSTKKGLGSKAKLKLGTKVALEYDLEDPNGPLKSAEAYDKKLIELDKATKKEMLEEDKTFMAQVDEGKKAWSDQSGLRMIKREMEINDARVKDNKMAEDQILIDMVAAKKKLEAFNSDKAKYGPAVAELDAENIELTKKEVDLEKQKKALGDLKSDVQKASTDGDKAKLKTATDSYNKQLLIVNGTQAEIDAIKTSIETKKDDVNAIEERLNANKDANTEITSLEEQQEALQIKIHQNKLDRWNLELEKMQELIAEGQKGLDSLQVLADAGAQITQDQMDIEDNKLAEEKNRMELSAQYREADSQEQQQMMYEAELATYNAKKKAFEDNKKFQIASVIIQGANNTMSLLATLLDPKTGGPISPINIAAFAAGTIANIATTISSVKKIKSTTLDAPIPPSAADAGGTSRVGGSASNNNTQVALNPNKTALTSKEENLNMMSNANLSKMPTQVVRVSEINEVQSKVKVLEETTTF